MSQKSETLPLLVVSSDKYEPFWPLFYGLMESYDSMTGWDMVYHLSESKTFANPGIKPILSNLPAKPQYWSQNLLCALNMMEGDYVVIMLEDFFLKAPVDFDRLKNHVQYIKEHDEIGCIRLGPIPDGNDPWKDDHYLEHTDEQPFKISTQTAIWRKSYLTELILIGEHPWDFELEGSKRASKMKQKVLVAQDDYPFSVCYFNAVIQGKLTKRAYNHCIHYGITPDLTKIVLMGRIQELYWNTKKMWLRKWIDWVDLRLMKIK
jgi:hypothetical protein